MKQNFIKQNSIKKKTRKSTPDKKKINRHRSFHQNVKDKSSQLKTKDKLTLTVEKQLAQKPKIKIGVVETVQLEKLSSKIEKKVEKEVETLNKHISEILKKSNEKKSNHEKIEISQIKTDVQKILAALKKAKEKGYKNFFTNKVKKSVHSYLNTVGRLSLMKLDLNDFPEFLTQFL